jgi:hypothetical protein
MEKEMNKGKMNYTAIPLSKLEDIREMLRPGLKGKKIRTFYLGPRPSVRGIYPRQTVRADAVAAKIAVYDNGRLVNYV